MAAFKYEKRVLPIYRGIQSQRSGEESGQLKKHTCKEDELMVLILFEGEKDYPLSSDKSSGDVPKLVLEGSQIRWVGRFQRVGWCQGLCRRITNSLYGLGPQQ